MLVLDTVKTGKDAAKRAFDLYDLFLKKHKRNFDGDICSTIAGHKPHYIHQVICRGPALEEQLLLELYKETYGP